MVTLWKALVPESGECRSLQGELVRADGRLNSEHYRNGFGNYYAGHEETEGFEGAFYPRMLVFILTTLIANANEANDAAAIAYFEGVLARAPADWDKQRAIDDLVELVEDEEQRDYTDAENEQLEELANAPERLAWEEVLERLTIGVANYCLANPLLVERADPTKPIEEGGVRDLRHVFDPPPPPPACPICNGRGWLPAKSAADFPTMCSCKTPPATLH